MTNLFNNALILCDAPRPWGVYFQDSASPQMEALIELHDNIMFYLVIILFGLAWILFSIIRNYVNNKSILSNRFLNHGTLIELIWTITPALILILIAFPSFKLLYLMDEVTDPSLTLFVEGHQWYWSYQYPDFLNDEGEELEYDSYLIPESGLDHFSEQPANTTEGEFIKDPHWQFETDDTRRTCSNCTHEELGPVCFLESDEIACDINPEAMPDGSIQSHLAYRDGVEPSTCLECGVNICHDCRPREE